MVHPDSPRKILWDTYIIILSIIIAIEYPLRLVLSYTPSQSLRIMDIIVPISFFIDIIINFNTGAFIETRVTYDRHLVIRKYLKRWFSIDLLAALPLTAFVSLFSSQISVINFSGINRVIKLVKVFSFINRIRRNNYINPSVLRLLMLIFWILLVAHYISCAWIYIQSIDAEVTKDNITLYVRSLYWTITTMTTIGYGDITPQNNLQTVFVIFIEIVGAGLYGFLIGNIANLIANIDIAKTHFREKMERIGTFMKYRNLPLDMQLQINNYYNYLWNSRKGYDETEVLNDLPIPLKTNVSLYLNKEIIEKVPIFKNAEPAFIREIILQLKPAVFSPGDHIFRKGDAGTEMYFISRGSVVVVSEDEKVVYATLSVGQFFGEIALLLSEPRTATLKAAQYCDLYVLAKDTFDNVLKRYPEFAKNVELLARKRKAEMETGKK